MKHKWFKSPGGVLEQFVGVREGRAALTLVGPWSPPSRQTRHGSRTFKLNYYIAGQRPFATRKSTISALFLQ